MTLLMIVQQHVCNFISKVFTRVKVHFAYLIFLWHLRLPALAVAAATMASEGTVYDRVEAFATFYIIPAYRHHALGPCSVHNPLLKMIAIV
jgi:hypothetical protein